MKRYIAFIALLAILCTMFSGCSFWEGEYISVEPYQRQGSGSEKTIIEVANYQQMCDAVIDLLESGAESGILYAPSFGSGTVHFYMDSAIRNAVETTPVGAYAVDTINYEIGTRSGVEAIALSISYRRGLSQILRMEDVENMQDGFRYIDKKMKTCEQTIAFRVMHYEETDVIGYVSRYVDENPDVVMEKPAVEVFVYPESGDERIVELVLTYERERNDLLRMQEKVTTVFTSAELYARGADQVREKYAQLYAFLMERTEYAYETSSTPAYTLLIEGKGDCEAFAKVYAKMCQMAGIDCYVVSGTRDGEPWTWNVIDFRGSYYHLDLLRCHEENGFDPKLRSAMEGYTWDSSALPD